ncbi:MAG: hypothetical protein ACKVG6_05365 [Alphaproteobacteria bacterium]|jgi:hypothetical protein|tara:strand:- start:63 stop:245 length:183 start_codon:yes stop_codon:yes gene_type:complete
MKATFVPLHAPLSTNVKQVHWTIAFLAATSAYRERHPETTDGDTAMIVSDIMQEMPRAAC